MEIIDFLKELLAIRQKHAKDCLIKVTDPDMTIPRAEFWEKRYKKEMEGIEELNELVRNETKTRRSSTNSQMPFDILTAGSRIDSKKPRNGRK